jgi:enamine deaminase RidA (YjgF/YER057c/UK114 family)
MAHDRRRKFNIRDWFGQTMDWDGAMVVKTPHEIFVRGQTGAALDGSRMHGLGHSPEDAAAQADVALGNLKILLEEAGSGLDDICKITVYISDRAFRIPVYRTIGRHLRGVHPVSTGIIMQGFARPEILFEIDVAVVPQRGTPHRRLRTYHTDKTRYGNEWQPLDCDFAMGVVAGRRVFLRGQTGQDLSDTLHVKGDAGAQAAQAMQNVETLLGEAGASLSDVARVVLYATDRAHLPHAREAVLRHLGQVPCAMSDIIVKGLANPDLLMEVDVFAVLP